DPPRLSAAAPERDPGVAGLVADPSQRARRGWAVRTLRAAPDRRPGDDGTGGRGVVGVHLARSDGAERLARPRRGGVSLPSRRADAARLALSLAVQRPRRDGAARADARRVRLHRFRETIRPHQCRGAAVRLRRFRGLPSPAGAGRAAGAADHARRRAAQGDRHHHGGGRARPHRQRRRRVHQRPGSLARRRTSDETAPVPLDRRTDRRLMAARTAAPEPLCRVVRFEATDGVDLSGLLYEPKKRTGRVAIFLHGTGGASIFESKRTNRLADVFTRNGIAYFPFNTRGAHLIRRLGRIQGGMAYELIRDCVFDIDGAVRELRRRGYRDMTLIGHS